MENEIENIISLGDNNPQHSNCILLGSGLTTTSEWQFVAGTVNNKGANYITRKIDSYQLSMFKEVLDCIVNEQYGTLPSIKEYERRIIELKNDITDLKDEINNK